MIDYDIWDEEASSSHLRRSRQRYARDRDRDYEDWDEWEDDLDVYCDPFLLLDDEMEPDEELDPDPGS